MEHINDIVQEIARTVFDNIPDENWMKAAVHVSMLTTYNESTAVYFMENSSNGISFDANYTDAKGDQLLDRLFIRLRKEMYSLTPGKGGWYNAQFTITQDGEYTMDYDYDNRPNFEMVSENDEYKIDTIEFARDEQSTPAWLKVILEGD